MWSKPDTWKERVRIRIARAHSGSVDGMSLARFGVGQIYDLPPTIASYLIALGSAEPLAALPSAGEPHAESAAVTKVSHSLSPPPAPDVHGDS